MLKGKVDVFVVIPTLNPFRLEQNGNQVLSRFMSPHVMKPATNPHSRTCKQTDVPVCATRHSLL